MTNWGAIMTGLVGIAGIFYAAWSHWLSLKHERTLADLAAVRTTVEDGAVHLHRVAYALDPVKQNLQGNAYTALAILGPLGKQYDEVSERLKVRLGTSHEVTHKYEGAGKAALEATRAVERVVNLHLPHMQEEGSGAKQARMLLDQDEAKLVEARSRFDDERWEFIEAAARTAGAKLPSH